MPDEVARLKPLAGLILEPRLQAFAYQLQAVEVAKGLPFSALFHEQGLGKTKIGIDLSLEWLRTNEVDCVLIVTKRSLIENWKEEIERHTHAAAAVLDQDHAANFYLLNSSARIFLTHYEVVKSEERRLTLFLKTRRVAAVLDESHKIKNPDAALSKSFHRIGKGFARRVIMTGTPVANRPYDLWSQIFFLDQGESLGTDFEDFRSKLELSNDLWADEKKRTRFESELATVFDRIRAFTVRETKATAGIELPDKVIENRLVAMMPQQAALYRKFRDDTRADVMGASGVVEDDAEDLLKRLLRLVQVASNPGLVDKGYTEEPGKLRVLREMVGSATAAGAKVIVWTSFVQNAVWLANELKAYGAVAVHGEAGMPARNASIAQFKAEPACRVLVATPGAAKEGLTLTMANHAIFYDRSFSLDDYLQAQDRIHRISQTQTCFVWNLVAEDTVDEWVDALLGAKRLAAQLVQSDITAEAYAGNADYDFGRMVKEVLGMQVSD